MAVTKSERPSVQPGKAMSGNVLAMGLVSFLTDFSTEMIYPLLPRFLTVYLHASLAFAGAMEGIAESVASVLKLFSGALADLMGVRKPLALAGYSLSSLAKPLVALATSPWQVLAVRVSDRIGKGIRTTPRDALIADSVTVDERGKAFGLQRTMDHAGAVAGPLVGAALLAFLASRGHLSTGHAYRIVFGLACVPALLCIVVLAAWVREIKPTAGGNARIQLSLRGFDRVFLAYLAIVCVFTLGNSSDFFILLRASGLGLTAAQVPLAWVLLHVVKMTTSIPGGMLSDQLGRRKVIIAGWTVYALVYAGFAFGRTPLHAWVLFAVYGIYFGFTEGVEKAFVADLVRPDLRGTAYGAYNFAIGIGALPASALMGLLWTKYGVVPAFGFGAAMAFLAAVLLLAVVPEGQRLA
jgi:MFS family permease